MISLSLFPCFLLSCSAFFSIFSPLLHLLSILFQSLPIIRPSHWTWGNGGCSTIAGVSLDVIFSLHISFPVCFHHSLGKLGIYPCSDAWSLDPSPEPSASSSRGCIQRAVKIAHGKGTGIYSCSITDREEYIGAFRWGYYLASLCWTRACLLCLGLLYVTQRL